MNKLRFAKGGWCRKLSFLLVLVLMASIFVTTASASSIQKDTYDTYNYWTAPGVKTPVSSTPMYEYKTTINGATLGISAFSDPADVFVDKNGLIYLADKGNGRVVVMNEDYTLNTIISDLSYKGEALDMTGLCGVFVTDDNRIYIADTENARVVVTNLQKQVTNILYLPEDDVIPENFAYKPEKIAIDSEGYTYILSNGSYFGAVLYDPDGNFSGFYGSNSVTGSIFDIFSRIYEMIFVSESMMENREISLPYCFTDIAIDETNFVYTATAPSNTNVTNTGQLKKLSPGGTNILKNKTTTTVSSAESFNFADGRGVKMANASGYYAWRLNYINSMDVDHYGYMYGLDQAYGHVVIYDQECNHLTTFGGGLSAGNQKGTFTKAVCVQVNDRNQDVLVVDETLKSITIFSETEYGALVKKAQSLTNAGSYAESKEYWEEALSYDRNCQLANRGLARVALIEEDYETTLYYAELGFDQDTYSQAFGFVRNDYLTDNFIWIIGIALLIVAAIIVFVVYTKKKQIKVIKNPKLATMFQCVVHPFEGAKQVRYYNNGSAKIATVLLVLYFIASIINEIYSGFMFNMLDKSNYSAMFTLIRTFGIVLLWTVCNWAMTTLFQGKGTMKHIYIVTCYSLIPLIASNLLTAVLTNVFTPEEALVITAIGVVCTALTGIMLCVGTMTVHEFGFFKFILMTLVILLAMIVCVFVIMMIFVLIQQLITFIGTIYKEVSYR